MWYLSEKLAPDFRTISDFRKDNPELLKEVFKHTVCFAKEEGLLDLLYLSTDGSKVRSNASNRKVLTREELTVLLKFVEDELDIWERQDAIEDKEFGEFRGIDQLPKGSKEIVQKAAELYLKKARENGIKFKEELKGQLQRAEREVQKEGLRKVSLTDPESCFMKTKGGKIELSYNPQVTVDRKGFIPASEVHQNASDAEQLQPQVEQTKENPGNLPDQVVWSLDAGYFGSDNIKFLADRNVDGYIPNRNEKKATNPFDKANFIYSALRDEYICLENQKVTFLGESLTFKRRKPLECIRTRMFYLPPANCMYKEKGRDTIP